jgi:hypothetical protein
MRDKLHFKHHKIDNNKNDNNKDDSNKNDSNKSDAEEVNSKLYFNCKNAIYL